MADLAEQWQKRLDADFPNGLALARDFGRPDGDAIPVAVIKVEKMVGLDPVVALLPASADRMPWILRLISYESLQDHPTMVRVKPDGVEDQHPMIWTALLRKEPLTRQVARWKDYYAEIAAGKDAEVPS